MATSTRRYSQPLGRAEAEGFTVAVITYFEDYNKELEDEEDNEEGGARTDGTKARYWLSDTFTNDPNGPRKLMFLAPEIPQDMKKRKELEDAKSKEIAALGWEKAERMERQKWMFDKSMRD